MHLSPLTIFLHFTISNQVSVLQCHHLEASLLYCGEKDMESTHTHPEGYIWCEGVVMTICGDSNEQAYLKL